MSAVAQHKQETFSIRQVAQDIMRQCGAERGTPEYLRECTESLLQYCLENEAAREAVLLPMLRQGCYETVRGLLREKRGQVYVTSGYDPEGKTDRIRGFARSLMEWPLPGGKPLGEATGADVLSAAEFYERQAEQMQSTAAWLSAIASRLAPQQKVKNALSEAQLAEMRK